MRRTRRVLVAAYYFPPVGGGGVTRTLRVVRALECAEYHSVVLTVDGAAWAFDASRLAEVPAATTVVRLPNPDWGRLAAMRGEGGHRPALGAGGGRLRRWLVPDLHVGWSALAAGAAALLAAVRAVDLVYTTAPPYSAMAAGFAAHALGIPWIADFRDGWTCCPTRADLPHRRVAFERRLEDAVLRRADRVLFASPAVRARCRTRVPDLEGRSETLLTGFDPEEFATQGPPPAAPPLEVVHAGSVCGAQREATLEGLLAALGAWVAAEPSVRDRVRVRLLGAEPAAAARVARAELGPLVEVAPAVPRAQLAAALRRAHLCLAIQPPGPRGGDPIPGKCFDAAGAGRPLLAVAPPGAFPTLVAEQALGASCAPGDGPALVALLRRALVRAERGEPALPFDASRAAALAAPRAAARVAALCDELLQAGGLRCPSPSAS